MKKALLFSVLLLAFVSFRPNEAISQCDSISLIGEFNGWAGDQFMDQDPVDTNMWSTTLILSVELAGGDSTCELKFRANADWAVNWGSADFPTGTGTQDGANIPVWVDMYDSFTIYYVTFNCSTGEYAFTEVCSNISLIGSWTTDWTVDYDMTRDTVDPYAWSTRVAFDKTAAGTNYGPDTVEAKFRENHSWTINWGAHSFPSGVGTQDGANIPIPIDTTAMADDYFVKFNCNTGAYDFIHTSVVAPESNDILVDGILNEDVWSITEPITQIVMGAPVVDLNTVHFGVVYNADSLYIGIDVVDPTVTFAEMGELFIDGDNSGGVYDSHDAHLMFNGAGVTVIQGPEGLTCNLGFQVIGLTEYSAEVAIPLADLGIMPADMTHVGLDIHIGDSDNGTSVDYIMAWSGGMEDAMMTSNFGKAYFKTYAGINEYSDYSSYVSLYPNPSNGEVTLQVADNVFNGQAVNVQILDITGRSLMNDQYNLGTDNMINIDAKFLPSGVYFITLEGNDGMKAAKKLIIQ